MNKRTEGIAPVLFFLGVALVYENLSPQHKAAFQFGFANREAPTVVPPTVNDQVQASLRRGEPLLTIEEQILREHPDLPYYLSAEEYRFITSPVDQRGAARQEVLWKLYFMRKARGEKMR